MNLNDLFRANDVDPKRVLVLRHRPHEPEFRRVLPWLAAERPEIFNAYQQTQGEKVERVMQQMVGSGYVASFIGRGPGQALFVGLYSVAAARPLTYEAYWEIPAHQEMKAFGVKGWSADDTNHRPETVWFDLVVTEFYAHWKGRLVVGWPPPERSWWRRASRNVMPVLSVLEDSALETAVPEWSQIELSWEELRVLPTGWRTALSHWRGIYYIFDTTDGKGYVGSAYGEGNLLGRWLNYTSHGHGGNSLLIERDPRRFRFSILQRVSPDMEAADVIRLESSWKQRLHTREPFGLNDN